MVDTVGVLSGEEPVAGGEVGMVEGVFNEVAGEAAAAVGSVDPDVAKVGEAGAIGDDAEKGGLGVVVEGAEDEGGVLGGALDAFEGDAGCPIGGGEPGMDAGPIDAGEVGGDLVIGEVGRCWLWLHGKVFERELWRSGVREGSGKDCARFSAGSFV